MRTSAQAPDWNAIWRETVAREGHLAIIADPEGGVRVPKGLRRALDQRSRQHQDQG